MVKTDKSPGIDSIHAEMLKADKKRQTTNNMEGDNYIRAGGNGFFYGADSVRCKGQRKMTANC